jgi:hypothetical protein
MSDLERREARVVKAKRELHESVLKGLGAFVMAGVAVGSLLAKYVALPIAIGVGVGVALVPTVFVAVLLFRA